MKLGQFLKKLLPSFEKNQIIEDIKNTRDELSETLPPLRSASEQFTRVDFKSRDVQEFQKRFVRATGDKSPNFVVAVCRMVESIDKNLNAVERLVDRYFAEDVIKDGMTYVRANLLQYVELMTFSIRYARHLLLWTYQVESQTADKSSPVNFTRGELSWLQDNTENFFKMYPFLTIPEDQLTKTINNIPDALITEDNVDVLAATVGLQKLDPFRMNFIGVKFNPIYHVRMAVAEWQVARLKLAKEERNQLELRLQHMRGLQEGVQDPKREQLIKYSEERLQKMKAKIMKEEDEANE